MEKKTQQLPATHDVIAIKEGTVFNTLDKYKNKTACDEGRLDHKVDGFDRFHIKYFKLSEKYETIEV
jgi:hypothetical protein